MRILILALLSATATIVPVAISSSLLPAGLSGVAHAVTNLNSSRSNIYRKKKVATPGTRATTVKSSKSNTSDRIGGAAGTGMARATTVKSSKSNTSDRVRGDIPSFGMGTFGR